MVAIIRDQIIFHFCMEIGTTIKVMLSINSKRLAKRVDFDWLLDTPT